MTGPVRRIGTTVRGEPTDPAGAGTFAVPAPAPVAAPQPWQPPSTTGPLLDTAAGDRKAREGRPMPEYPRHGYDAYRLLGRLPDTASWWQRLVDWALGFPSRLLYIGITSRARVTRWGEHLDGKRWARDVDECETIRGEHWATLNDTVIDDTTGLPWLVFDDQATSDDGIRPVRPGEHIHTDPQYRIKHDRTVEVFHLDPVAGVLPGGSIAEGARAGEKRLIQAREGDPRPLHNIEHNEGNHAVNRVARRFPRLIALARRQAVARVLVWVMLAIVVSEVPGSPVSGWVALLAGGALLQAGQVVRLVAAGMPGPRRRRARRPRGSKRRQRRRRARRR